MREPLNLPAALHEAGQAAGIGQLELGLGVITGHRFIERVPMRKFVFVFVILVLCGCVKSIHTAAIDQNIREVEQYLAKGEDINAADRYGFTPLIYAAYYGHYPMVKFLCEKGADVNRQNNEGQTALLYAAYYNHVNIARILLAHKADPNIVNNYGYNALEYAKKYEYKELQGILKAHGAKPLY